MSNRNFVKGECRRCAGHLEFPAEAAGETIACPHCGQPTELVAPIFPNKINRSSRMRLAIAIAALAVVAGLAAGYLWMQKAGTGTISTTRTAPATLSGISVVATVSSVVPAKPPVEELTNDFAISPVKLEKAPDSSLVYVTGKIRNLTNRQRFGVKIEFGLFDTNDTAVGKATDYQPVLEPNGDWHFKAMVMESKTASARLSSIVEDRQ